MNDISQKPSGNRHLVVVSNRLPFIMQKDNGQWKLVAGSGGLVSALAPVLRNRGGMWIGWPGSAESEAIDLQAVLANATKNAGYTLKAVMLTPEEKDKFYHGFSNEVIWPLFHDLQSHCNFDSSYWSVYQQVNQKFAHVISENCKRDDFIWVHDYHLMNVAKEMHAIGTTSKMAFFLHIPFPPLDIFVKLPWRFQLLQAILEYDLIGFQTLRDRRNFMQCIRTLLPDALILGKGQVLTVRLGEREVRLGAFPIGIDFNDFAKKAATEEVELSALRLRQDLPKRHVIESINS